MSTDKDKLDYLIDLVTRLDERVKTLQAGNYDYRITKLENNQTAIIKLFTIIGLLITPIIIAYAAYKMGIPLL